LPFAFLSNEKGYSISNDVNNQCVESYWLGVNTDSGKLAEIVHAKTGMAVHGKTRMGVHTRPV